MVFDDALLDSLKGNWKLSGNMGKQELMQNVTCDWGLNHQYLVMKVRDTDTVKNENYEAVYYIGAGKKSGQYVMHLIDIYGAAYSKIPGYGKKEGDTINFVFKYPDGPFHNQFIYDREKDKWQMHLKFMAPDGDWKNFAVKNLERSA